MSEYQTRATDRYYLDKVRRGLITPEDPNRDWLSDYEKRMESIVAFINEHVGTWFVPSYYDYGPCETGKQWFHIVKQLKERVGYPVESRRWSSNRKYTEFFFPTPVLRSDLPEEPFGRNAPGGRRKGTDIHLGRRS